MVLVRSVCDLPWPGQAGFLNISILSFAVACCLSTTSGIDRAVLADVAPKRAVSSIMAVEYARHQAAGALVGPTFVSLVATRMGYHSSTLQVSQMTEEQRQENAHSLGAAILMMCTVCYTGTCLFYGSLSLTYRADVMGAENANKLQDDDEHTPIFIGKAIA
eukprot:gnl/TRDRNA2_/TRDRNA2_35971_c0_seq1.p2 gnl/TRDRNA2_/TRDRNA2_35971_c0~~gnl/TRDRNA2_/TRDRNA2_35971_c0_seq1.p2  ORF type:complete len:162 (+),score=19.51 gnl/TRDRNA2_/TRDRNA2_35971_c0_seq1:982-1467(+)